MPRGNVQIAISCVCTWVAGVETIDRGIFKPAARNAPSSADRGMLPEGGRLQGWPSKSASLSLRRLARRLRRPNLQRIRRGRAAVLPNSNRDRRLLLLAARSPNRTRVPEVDKFQRIEVRLSDVVANTWVAAVVEAWMDVHPVLRERLKGSVLPIRTSPAVQSTDT